MFFLLSCKKEITESVTGIATEASSAQSKLATSNPDAPETAKFAQSTTSVTENYATTIFDSCRNESVNLNGIVTYKIKESFDRGYSISYTIDLSKVTGVGKITGTIWRGGGKITGVTSQSADGLDVKGRYVYNVTYHSTGGKKLSFDETGRFVQVNNVIKKETRLRTSFTCK